MRVIRTLVSEDDLETVLTVLEEHDIDYVVVSEEGDSEGSTVVEFPLPTQAVERILDELRDAGFPAERYTVVAGAESVVSEHADEMEERFITGEEEDDSIATEEVRSRALDLTPSPLTYYSMTLLSALVATAGLLLDSPAVVVGSMVIAPLVGSALTASVGTVLADRTMILEGFKAQVFGLVAAVAGATLFSRGLRTAEFLPPALDVATTTQIANRVSPGLLSAVIGVCAGAAGAFGLATGISVSLVGVMIAAALIPAAAAVGIGVAWGIPEVALGGFVMLVTNVIAIHGAAVSVLWHLGYRPRERDGDDVASLREVPRFRPASMVAVMVVLGTVFLGAGLVVHSHVRFEQSVNSEVSDLLDREEYEALELVSVRTGFDGPPPLDLKDRQRVTVVVGRPADRAYPDLSDALARAIADRTDRNVVVVVEFVERQTASGHPDGRASNAVRPGDAPAASHPWPPEGGGLAPWVAHPRGPDISPREDPTSPLVKTPHFSP